MGRGVAGEVVGQGLKRITTVDSRKRGWLKLTLRYVSFDLGSLRFISVNTNENETSFWLHLASSTAM